MSLILNIETSTSVCSVALSEGEEVVFEKASFEGPSHAALLGVYMEEALEAAKSKGIKLDAVAVSSGPGSYTGLRIGVSVAKGLCFGYGILRKLIERKWRDSSFGRDCSWSADRYNHDLIGYHGRCFYPSYTVLDIELYQDLRSRCVIIRDRYLRRCIVR